MSDDETKRWTAEVDAEIAEMAESRLEHGEKREVTEKLVEAIAHHGWDNRTPYDHEIKRLQEKRKEKEQERREAQDRIEEIDESIKRLQEKRDSYHSKEDKLEGSLETLDSQLRHSGMNIYPNQPAVEDVAREHGLATEAVVEKVRERNPDVPPRAFSNPMDNNTLGVWNGFDDEEVASLPPTEREDRYGGQT